MSIFALLSFFVSILCVFLGIFIYNLDKKRTLNRIFTLLCASVSLWAFAEFMYRHTENPDTAYLWIKVGSVYVFSAAFLFHFVLVFTETKMLRSKLTYFLIYIPALIFSSIDLATDSVSTEPIREFWGYTYEVPKDSVLYWISIIWAFGLVFSALVLCARHYLRTTDENKRQQTKYVIIGFSIPVFTAFFDGRHISRVRGQVSRINYDLFHGASYFRWIRDLETRIVHFKPSNRSRKYHFYDARFPDSGRP